MIDPMTDAEGAPEPIPVWRTIWGNAATLAAEARDLADAVRTMRITGDPTRARRLHDRIRARLPLVEGQVSGGGAHFPPEAAGTYDLAVHGLAAARATVQAAEPEIAEAEARLARVEHARRAAEADIAAHVAAGRPMRDFDWFGAARSITRASLSSETRATIEAFNLDGDAA